MEAARSEPIAIVGMGCRLPGGVASVDAFWELLREGRCTATAVPADRWDVGAYYDPDPDARGRTYVHSANFIDDVAGFDSQLFDISPREVMTMDPQHRLVLEVGWMALEHAGIAPDSLLGSRSGVFFGLTAVDYAQIATKSANRDIIDAYMGSGNALNFASGRLSYLLGLRGRAWRWTPRARRLW